MTAGRVGQGTVLLILLAVLLLLVRRIVCWIATRPESPDPRWLEQYRETHQP